MEVDKLFPVHCQQLHHSNAVVQAGDAAQVSVRTWKSAHDVVSSGCTGLGAASIALGVVW